MLFTFTMKNEGQNDNTNSERMSEEESSAILDHVSTHDDLELRLGLGSMYSSSSSSSSSYVSRNNVTADGHENKSKSRSTPDLKIKPLMFKKIKKTIVRCRQFFGVTIHASDTVVEHLPVYNPTPLRSFPSLTTTEDNIIPESDQQDNVDTTLRLSIAPPDQVPTNNNDSLPLNNFSRILHQIEFQLGGTKPVLLCSKRLTQSDVSRNQNRLFITKSEKLMEFLNDEERRQVEDIDEQKIWLEVYAIDTLGESYKLHLSRWKSLKMVVVNGSEWQKLISANKAEENNLIELWGYRQNSKFHLAVNFKQSDPVAETSNASSSSKKD